MLEIGIGVVVIAVMAYSWRKGSRLTSDSSDGSGFFSGWGDSSGGDGGGDGGGGD